MTSLTQLQILCSERWDFYAKEVAALKFFLRRQFGSLRQLGMVVKNQSVLSCEGWLQPWLVPLYDKSVFYKFFIIKKNMSRLVTTTFSSYILSLSKYLLDIRYSVNKVLCVMKTLEQIIWMPGWARLSKIFNAM